MARSSAAPEPPQPAKRPWWKGPEKPKYDPFAKDVEAPLPFTQPMSTSARIMTALTVALAGGSAGYVLLNFRVPEGHELYRENATLSERVQDNLKYGYQWVLGEHSKSEKLLPDPLPPPYFPEYTLVVDVEGTLVKTTWDAKRGYVSLKRPGLDKFLSTVAASYELVAFADTTFIHASPIVQQLDPYGQFFMYSLYKDACVMKQERPTKDLSLLNRRLNRLISIDDAPDSSPEQPGNVIHIKPWDGDPQDRELLLLLPLLEAIPKNGVDDVRVTLASFGNADVGRKYLEFASQRDKKLRSMKGPMGSGLMR